MKSLKKAFSSFVSMTTILWSVGGTLAFPNVASAATLNMGDLIKASGPAVYYYAADGKRYVFPNEKTYFSWYAGFSSVKTITDAELAAIMIGGNVTIRPGTKLVKITTDPKVYAVTGQCGMLHWIETEAVAKALYGDAWAQRVVDVPDAFFVNYSIGSSLATAVHPDGQLVTMTGDSNWYLVWGGAKRKVLDAAKTANNLNGSYAVPTTIVYSNGADVTGYEAAIGGVACTSQSTPISGSVNVALASDTPAGATVPKNAASVALAKFTLSAGANPALVTGLSIRRIGVGATSDFSNVYLYDANGARITTGRTINSSTNVVQFNSLNLNIPANSSISVVLTGDLSSPGTAGGQHAFELSDAASVVLSGSGTVGGSFPVRGNVFTVGTTLAAELDVMKGTTPANPTVGAMEAEISNFKLVANTNDIEVRRITLLQSGDVSNADLSDLKLYQGTTMVASAASLMNDKIVLNFNPAFVIEKGQTKTFILKAKIAGRAARTIRTYVEYTTDVYAVDRLYNSGAAIDIDDAPAFDGTSFTSCASPGNSICVTTQGGQLTTAFNGPAASNVAKGTQDVKLYTFAMTSSDGDLEVRKLRFRIDSTTGGQLEEGTTDYFTDIKVIDTATGQVIMGPASLPATAASGTNFILTDTFWLTAGVTRNFAVTADLANSSDTDFVGEGYRVCLGNNTTATGVAAGTALSTTCDTETIFEDGDVKIVGTGENLDVTGGDSKAVPNVAISGNTMTVQASSLTVTLASSPSASTYVKKQTNVDATGFVFSAGTESSARVTRVQFTGTGDVAVNNTYALADLNDVVTSCGLFDGATQVGTSQSPDGTTGAMNFTGLNVTIAAGASKTLVVKCSLDSTIDGTFDHFAIGIASGDVTAEDKDANEITESLSAAVIANAATTGQSVIQTVRNSGTLAVTAGSQPQSTIVTGGSMKKFSEFKATAQYEAVTIDRINVTSTGQAANFTSVFVRVAGADMGADVLSTGVDQNKDVVLSTPVVVPKDGNVTFELWGTLANVVASSTVGGATAAPRSGNQQELGLAVGVTASPWDANYTSSIFNVFALGGASGERLYADGSATTGNSGNAMVLRKTKPTFTKLAVSTNTLTSGADSELYKFQITPDATGGALAWKQITFTITTSSAVGLSNFKLFKGSTQLTANTEVFIMNAAGTDLTGSNNAASSTIIVRLVNEEVVSGSGTVYTLRATPTYSGSTATVSTQFARSSTVATGYLAANAGVISLGIDTGTSVDGTIDAAGTFLWSDNSEVPHSFATGTSASRDWTNDVYVEDMTQTQSLSQ